MKVGLIRIKDALGVVHIQPNMSHDPASTLCYSVDDWELHPLTPTNEVVTCDSCQIEFDNLRHGLKLVKCETKY
jgi:hypothetical protein